MFGVNRRQVASFEKAAKRASTGRQGSADVFWPEYLLAEHKSRTTPPMDLAKALDEQAADYLDGNSIPGYQYPRILVVSDFARFRTGAKSVERRSPGPIADLVRAGGLW